MRNLSASRRVALVVALFLLCLSFNDAQAAPGSLDTTFGSGGVVITPIGSGYDDGRAVAIQPDGKIVAAGYSVIGSTVDFALVRYNTDGTPDTSFNGTGKVTTPIGSNFDEALGVAIQPNGRIVAGGFSFITSGYDLSLVRYNTDGSLDNSFSEGGKVINDLGSIDDEARAMALQPNGRIVLAGDYFNGSDDDFVVARYHTDQHAHSDFDGDNRSDLAVWNPTTRNWNIRQSRSNTDRVQID